MRDIILKSWEKQCYLVIDNQGEIIIGWPSKEELFKKDTMYINAKDYASMIDYL